MLIQDRTIVEQAKQGFCADSRYQVLFNRLGARMISSVPAFCGLHLDVLRSLQ